MNLPRILILIFVAMAIGLFFYFDGPQYLTLETLKAQHAKLIAFKAENTLYSIVLFGLLYIAVTALSLPGAAILTLAGGALFGFFGGVIVVSFASSIGATLAFLAARFLFKDSIQNKFGDRLVTINEGINQDGAYYLFSLRLVPLFPFFIINLLMGLTTIKTTTFYWVSQVGMFAGTLVYVNAGTQLANIDSLSSILSPALVGSFCLLGIFPLIAKKFVEKLPHD